MSYVDSGASGTASGRKTIEERKEMLSRAVASQLAQGGRRVETQSDFSSVLVQGKPVNHVLHVILSVLTFGFWAIVWIILVVIGGEKREMISVDQYGNSSI